MVKASVICVPLHDGLYITIDGDNLKRQFTQKDGEKLKELFRGRSEKQISADLKKLGYDHAVKVGVMEKSSNS